MKTKRFAAAACTAALLGTLAVNAGAEKTPNGYVYFIAEKSVLGQGLTVEPVKVPYFDGEKGIDIVLKAAEIDYSQSDYGPFITGFKDEDNGAAVPEIISSACEGWGGRYKDGYLCAYDYTPESGWSYFFNDEYAMIGIGDYVPSDGDVIRFSFTVYGYGADIGIDNSSWGGAAALITPAAKAELTKICADTADKDSDEYKNAVSVLSNLTATQDEVDTAAAELKAVNENTIGNSEPVSDELPEEAVKPGNSEEPGASSGEAAPETGVNGFGSALLVAVIAGGTAIAARLKKHD